MARRLPTRWLTLVLVTAAVLALALPASATFPGKNGRIAFVGTRGQTVATSSP